MTARTTLTTSIGWICLLCGSLAFRGANAQEAAVTEVAANESLSSSELDQVLAREQARIEMIAKVSAPTLAVFGSEGGGGGSGVVITPDGYALTNYHVAQPCGDHMRCGMNDGKMYDAVIVGIDPTGDVALIKLLGRDDFPTAELGDSDALRVGEECAVVGNPFVLATDFRPTVTYGIISGTHRYQYPAGTLLEYADCIQTDASINPGNSGGPLFNSRGQLVGINGRGSFEKRGRVNVGVGYAISINQIKKFYGYLKSGRVVDHATLGATVSTDDDGRVVVSDLLSSSDAYRRGLRAFDEIVEFGGRRIRSVNEFKNILGTFPRDWRVPLTYRRNGDSKQIAVRLTGLHNRERLLAMLDKPPEPQLPMPPAPEEKDEQPDGAEGLPKIPGLPKEIRDKLPQPRQGDKPNPPKGKRGPHGGRKAKAGMPEHVAKLFQQKRGFANAYFNEFNLDRIFAKSSSVKNFRGLRDEWVIDAVDGTDKFQFLLRDSEAFVEAAEGFSRIDMNGDLDTQLEPATSGGLLLALQMWRRLLVEGPKEFGQVTYRGTAPGIDIEQMRDVVVATYDVVETWFYFDQETGELTALEMFPTVQTDPCTLLFQNYNQIGKHSLPGQIEARHGDNVFGTFGVTIKPGKSAGRAEL